MPCFAPRGRSRFFAFLAWAALSCGAEAADAEEEEPPNYLRPALEIGAGLAAASLWYFIDDRNVLDWDRPSAEERFNGEAWRFDNNTFALNYVWHPLAGGGMYVLGRGNRLGVWPSFGYSLAGSTLWEYVIEFNEKVSINDMMVTPLSGLAIGEFFHKLALHVADSSPLLGYTFGLSVHGHRRLDGLGPVHEKLWNDLAFSYAFGVVEPSGGAEPLGTHVVGFDGRFVSLPGYRGGNRLGHWFHEAELSSFELEVDLGAEGPGVDAFAETLLAGYHFQDSRAYATAALGVAYIYRNTEAFGFDDRQGLLLFPGLASETGLSLGALRASAAVSAYPSFGSMSVPSYRIWRLEQPEGRTKTVLQREGYVYGWGFNARAEARVGFQAVELRGELGYGYFSSIEGLDRAQERVELDPHVVETPLDYGVSAWATRLPVDLELGAVFEGRLRVSRMPAAERRLEGRRLLLKLALRL